MTGWVRSRQNSSICASQCCSPRVALLRHWPSCNADNSRRILGSQRRGPCRAMSLFTYDVAAKGAQFLKELLPTATAIAYLVNSSNPTAELYVKEAASTASALGISVHVLSAATEHELDGAFGSTTKLGVEGVVVPAEPFFDS